MLKIGKEAFHSSGEFVLALLLFLSLIGRLLFRELGCGWLAGWRAARGSRSPRGDGLNISPTRDVSNYYRVVGN